MSLTTRALLINLTIGMPPQSKKVVRKSEQVESEEGTAHKQVSVITKLYAKEDVSDLQKAATAARQLFKERTLPWGRGMGLIPTSKYLEFMEDMRRVKEAFEAEAKYILCNIDNILQNAMAVNGGLFDRSNYSGYQELADAMYFSIEATPVPAENSFDQLAGLSEDDINKLKAEAVVNAHSRTEAVIKDLFSRLFTSLQHAAERLGPTDNGETKIFRDTLIDNIQKAVLAAETLNVTDNSQITAITEEVKRALDGITAQDLRKDTDLRAQTRQAVESIAKKVGEFL